MKRIVLKENFNNKLLCNAIVHLAPAPARMIPESKMGQEYEFTAEDGGAMVRVYRLVDMVRVRLWEVPSMFSLPSHGMMNTDFIMWWMDTYKTDGEFEMAAYFYGPVVTLN